MTSMRAGGDAGFGSRAADSAGCLLVVGGYREDTDLLRRVMVAAQERILMSPSLGDFFELRPVDMGPRPAQGSDEGAGVARLVFELTSRPGEVARNFSALAVLGESAVTVDRVLRICQADQVLSRLKVRFRGMAGTEDRPKAERSWVSGTAPKIVIAPDGTRWHSGELATEISRYAEDLLADFGSGGERGLPAADLNELGAMAESQLRAAGTAVRADMAATVERRRDELRRQNEEREAALQKEAERSREAERREAERREQRRDAELRRAAGLPEAGVAGELEVGHATGAQRHPELSSGNARDEASVDETKPEPRKPDRKLAGVISRVIGRAPALPAGGTEPSMGVTILLDCVARMRAGDRREFEDCLTALQTYADAEISAEQRRLYRVIVVEDRLLGPGLPPAPQAVQFYEVMLRLAYGLPLSYPNYCEVEGLLPVADEPGQRPHRPLLEAIRRGGTSDIRVAAITCYHLGEERLTSWFRSGQVDVGQLISVLAGPWERRRHAELLYAVTLQYLTARGNKDRQAVRDGLRAHGYLAFAVQEHYPESKPDQVTVLRAFLGAAYPGGLDRRAVTDAFAMSTITQALLAAVLRSLADPEDRVWAVRKFAEMTGIKEINSSNESAVVKLFTSGERE